MANFSIYLPSQLLKCRCFPRSVFFRLSNTLSDDILEHHRRSELAHDREEITDKTSGSPRHYMFVNPDFFRNSDIRKRDRLCEKLERRDMVRRRAIMEVPEFYVGSVMAVTTADPFAPGKENRFVGICIQRDGYGLRSNFTLRNVVGGQGIEIRYDTYSPALQKIEVLRLEKRLDDELFYLRDAPPEYSTFPFDMEPTPLPLNAVVPVNPMKVKLGPRPWGERWERKNCKGLEDLGLPQRFYDKAKHPQVAKPWEKYDLMMEYRETLRKISSEKVEGIEAEEFEAKKKKVPTATLR